MVSFYDWKVTLRFATVYGFLIMSVQRIFNSLMSTIIGEKERAFIICEDRLYEKISRHKLENIQIQGTFIPH